MVTGEGISLREDAASLRRRGNEMLHDGNFRDAVVIYQQALGRSESGTHEAALVLGNMSVALLNGGDAAKALSAAEDAAKADPSYSKAYYRQARALLGLGRPAAAAAAVARTVASGQPLSELRSLLSEVRTVAAAAAARRAATAESVAGMRRQWSLHVQHEQGRGHTDDSDLEATRALDEILTWCGVRELACLGRCARRFCVSAPTFDAFMQRAVAFSPCRSAAWLRTELLAPPEYHASGGMCLGLAPGWLAAAQEFRALSGVSRTRLAVCSMRGIVHVGDYLNGSFNVVDIPMPPGLHCLSFTLCISSKGRYVVWIAARIGDTDVFFIVFVPVTFESGKGEGFAQPIVLPLPDGIKPYFLYPSPCGSRVALLTGLRGRQALIEVDALQAISPPVCRDAFLPPTFRLICFAAPLYFDWAPDAPELVAILHAREVVRFQTRSESVPLTPLTVPAATRSSSATTIGCMADAKVSSLASASIDRDRMFKEAMIGYINGCDDVVSPSGGSCLCVRQVAIRDATNGNRHLRAPQWLPDGSWLLPRATESRVPLVVVDPAAEDLQAPPCPENIMCSHLPSEVAQFAASRTSDWVAWTGRHDRMGHGGTFARKRGPLGSGQAPSPVYLILSTDVAALAWCGDRLAMLVENLSDASFTHKVVWAVWDPPSGDTSGKTTECRGSLLLSPELFTPNSCFAERVLPFFDQFERSVRFWNPEGDEFVFANQQNQIWMQPFPRPPHDSCESHLDHPFWSTVLPAAENASMAPKPTFVCEGNFACFGLC
eukprot:TRINITY_DN42283_c0_g1_i1.p1 TRINITY_DN42283_c0_g1~~TRINITY_DN42283_c0_g1_i1.p1  ORF type:complete len:775 (+),score=90.65 TRINITY_DN42283_c0_g1_i1:93-2417(+)